MKKISTFQYIARGLVTLMLAGAAVVIVCSCTLPFIAGSGLGERQVEEMKGFVNAVNRFAGYFSFLLELIGIAGWSFVIALFLPMDPAEFGIGALGDDADLKSKIGVMISGAVLLAVVIFLLILSRYLTKEKGARTACAVFLGLILVDLPAAPVVSGLVGSGEALSTVQSAASMIVHLAAAVMLILSLRHICLNREEFGDFIKPKEKPAAVSAAQVVNGEGAIVENALTRAGGDSSRQGGRIAMTARVLTIILSVGTLLSFIGLILSTEMFDAGLASGKSGTDTYLGLTHVSMVIAVMGSFVLPIVFRLIAGLAEGGAVVMIGMGVITALFAAVLLWGQRFFTKKSPLTRPMLILTLTVVVIDTAPYLSPLILMIPGSALHGMLIGMLIAAIRKTE